MPLSQAFWEQPGQPHGAHVHNLPPSRISALPLLNHAAASLGSLSIAAWQSWRQAETGVSSQSRVWVDKASCMEAPEGGPLRSRLWIEREHIGHRNEMCNDQSLGEAAQRQHGLQQMDTNWSACRATSPTWQAAQEQTDWHSLLQLACSVPVPPSASQTRLHPLPAAPKQEHGSGKVLVPASSPGRLKHKWLRRGQAHAPNAF